MAEPAGAFDVLLPPKGEEAVLPKAPFPPCADPKAGAFCELLVPNAAFPVPNAELPVPKEVFPVPNAEFPVPNAELPVPNAEFPVPNAEFPVPNAEVPVPNAEFPVPNEPPDPKAPDGLLSEDEFENIRREASQVR